MSTAVHATKFVKQISQSLNPLRAAPTQFTPPRAPRSLSFAIPHLAGSIGRAVALNQNNKNLVSVLTTNSQNLLAILVDPFKSDFAFLGDVRDLADHMRTAFSAECGAGIADLYMLQLGYSLHCNGKTYLQQNQSFVLAHTRKVFDYVYQGPTGRDVVVAEAKGSIRDKCSIATLQTMVEDGYRNQVGLYVGKADPAGVTILHGYAVGIGAEPNGNPSFIHVEESGVPQPGGYGGGPDPADSSTHAGSPPPRGFQNAGQPTFLAPDACVTLGNYEAVFRLLEAHGVVAAIRSALEGQFYAIAKASSAVLPVVEWRGNRYVTSASVLSPPTRKGSPPAFGLREDVAEAFLRGLTHLAKFDALPGTFPQKLPIRPFDVDGDISRGDGGAEFPDGLAYFGDVLGLAATSASMVWNPPDGSHWSGVDGFRQSPAPVY